MKRHIPRIAEVDVLKGRIISVEGKRLLGECLRCGKCCQRRECVELYWETVNDKQTACCRVQYDKPTWCSLYPLPWDEILPGCGYSYEE